MQLCVVHLVRFAELRTLEVAPAGGADLQSISRAATVAEAEQHLAVLEAKWRSYRSVSQVWRRNWVRITPFFMLYACCLARRCLLQELPAILIRCSDVASRRNGRTMVVL